MNVLEHATFELTIFEGRSVLVNPRLTGNPLRLPQAPRRARRRRRSVTSGHHGHVGDLFNVARLRARGSSRSPSWATGCCAAGYDRVQTMNLGGVLDIDAAR